MAAASSADFDAKLKSWGLEAKMVEYLSELGLNSACAVAHAAVQDSELLEQVIVPFEQGVQIGDKTYKVEGVPIKWRVAMRHAWAECRKAEAPTPPASSAAAAAPAPAAAAPAPLSRRSKTELEPGEFEERAHNWEKQFTQHPRLFPRAILLGAEREMARVMWEKVVTRAFTPPPLGAVVFTRTFNPDGSLNELVSEPYVPASDDEADNKGKKQKYREPKTPFGFIHALEATKWLWTWAGICCVDAMEPLVEHIKRLLESGTSLALCRRLFQKLLWVVCSEMQKGVTADTALGSICNDRSFLQAELRDLENQRAPHLDYNKDTDKRGKREFDQGRNHSEHKEHIQNLQNKLKFFKDRSWDSKNIEQEWQQHRRGKGAPASSSWEQSASDWRASLGRGRGSSDKGGKGGKNKGYKGKNGKKAGSKGKGGF